MSETATRPRTATYARGEDTRRRLIEAAIEAFGTYGYDATSTRRLAEQAGTTLPSIQYYFGGKEGLYRSAIGDIVASLDARLSPAATRVHETLADPAAPRPELIARLCDMLTALLGLVAAGDDSRKRFINRAAIERNAALAALHEGMRRTMIDPCVALVARLTGRVREDETVVLRTLAVIGQVSVFCNSGARCALGWTDIGDRSVTAIQALVRQHIEAIFASPNASD
jgi:TetR/AcrR family transcriptional regulator, regulator of cefoperazone and chloramphenicol sensitivity